MTKMCVNCVKMENIIKSYVIPKESTPFFSLFLKDVLVSPIRTDK